MAGKIVAAVREAEIHSEQTLQAAIEASAAIKKQVEKDVELTIATMTKAAQDQAVAALAEAKILGDSWLKEAQVSAKQERAELRLNAKLKEQEAIRLILAELS